ncbi:DUF6397 family protein [Streptomyces sp. NPDC037389]|uniref:DUF6397 family protein n=1 Tax=Streptomyces sp. NPDC037389 TaxID=3155369 RepID=UPI0033D4EB00
MEVRQARQERQRQERGRTGAHGPAWPGVPFARAARELGLKPREFELAVHLGEVRTVSAGPDGRRRVPPEEIDRHGSSEGFPEALRSRLWAVGTAEGAELMGVSPARFTRLARAGCFTPVRFYVNRYRAVVWHYLAADLAEFADREPGLLTGRTPALLRTALDEHPDRRARGWRARRVDQLTAQTTDAWQRAAATAAVLDTPELAQAVPDPGERAYLSALRPELTRIRSEVPAAREVIESLVLAEDPDETDWYRHCLTTALPQARATRPAPGTDGNRQTGRDHAAGPEPGRDPAGGAAPRQERAHRPAPRSVRPGRLWSWLRGRR